ncbi:hypothetical protein KP001_13680 [Geomonas subterranea]|uniref:Uncharacterized protein n=1 Tax=Geomonas subterranea TaxID=2847989 RepID=A0ABX8LBV8_9BACT|nr:hypothetical protein [Geomonas subterranea]QXE89493.1 hypothetical protein KP001_13680 [Geomonas subterranea]QXM08392.1 hypothetical protein KP002_15595 [Geomonas subterranea]
MPAARPAEGEVEVGVPPLVVMKVDVRQTGAETLDDLVGAAGLEHELGVPDVQVQPQFRQGSGSGTTSSHSGR